MPTRFLLFLVVAVAVAACDKASRLHGTWREQSSSPVSRLELTFTPDGDFVTEDFDLIENTSKKVSTKYTVKSVSGDTITFAYREGSKDLEASMTLDGDELVPGTRQTRYKRVR
jgi:hypothetical protein